MRRRKLLDELTLGAYADGELDAKTAREVETALSGDSAAQRRLATLRDVSVLVKAATGRETQRLGGARIRGDTGSLAPRLETSRVAMGWKWSLAGALAAGVGAVLVISALLRPAPALDGWEEHALSFHQQYVDTLAAERRFPLDVEHSDPAVLATALEGTLGDRPLIPDLSAKGYEPRGARLIATPQGPLVYVLYEAYDSPLLGLALMKGATSSRRPEMRQSGEQRLLSWSDGETHFGLAGAFEAASLEEFMPVVDVAFERVAE